MKFSYLFPLVGLFSSHIYAHDSHAAHDHSAYVPVPEFPVNAKKAGGRLTIENATAFIASLSKAQQKKVLLGFGDPARKKWSNLPAAYVDRVGLSLGELSPAQREKLFAFLASSMSEEGYELMVEIIAGEAVLSGEKQAKRHKWAPENYWVSFYGNPSLDKAWSYHFGGHHLAVNMTIRDGKLYSMSPSFIGNSPGVFEYGGTKYQSMLKMHQAGASIYESQNKPQKQAADYGEIPNRLLTGAGRDGVVPELKGVKVGDLNAEQQKLVLDAIQQWATIQADEGSAALMKRITAELEAVRFTWEGKYGVNKPCYYRIQGPSFVIELLSMEANVGKRGEAKGHYHTVFREFARDYGSK